MGAAPERALIQPLSRSAGAAARRSRIVIRLRTLGDLELLDADGTELRALVAQPKRMALLVHLALTTPRGPQQRDMLLARFWPERDAEHARNSLSQAVHVLRRWLGVEAIVSHGADALSLCPARVWCDAVAFEAMLDAGHPAEALAHHRGPLLDGFHLADAPQFERWLEGERARLGERHAAALESVATACEAAGDPHGAVAHWRQLAHCDPYSSRIALRLMQALARSGDPGAAVQHARAHERLLREELEVAPDPAVAALVRRLRARPVPS
jgi:DNA-binding SARP family transcriptional activator